MAKILVVDDNATNRKLLAAVLAKAGGYTVEEAGSGENALKSVALVAPDIILLDIQMPGMDGFEVCRKLKADPKNKSIPILFITALEETADKVKGFECGAADYITKPINPEEVKARVGAHLRIRQAENDRMEADRLRTVKDMIATYNHNMNQPLMTIYTYLEILSVKADTGKAREQLAKIKKELDKINDILKKIQAIDTVKRTDYIGDTGMVDIEGK